jgi:hypothetical protein
MIQALPWDLGLAAVMMPMMSVSRQSVTRARAPPLQDDLMRWSCHLSDHRCEPLSAMAGERRLIAKRGSVLGRSCEVELMFLTVEINHDA